MLHKYSSQRKQAEMNTSRIIQHSQLWSKSIKWEVVWLFFKKKIKISCHEDEEESNIFIPQLTGDYISTPCFPMNQALEASSF